MFRRTALQVNNGEVENPFLLSFSDLMAGLLAVFILVLIFTLVELEKRKEELQVTKTELISSLKDIQGVQNRIAESLEGATQREHSLVIILAEIKQDLKDQGIKVEIAENGTVLRIPENQLQFALGQCTILATYAGSVTAIGKALSKALQNPANLALLDTVFIEGHTDSVKNYREMGNWGLSTYRAISLWNYWTENPGELAELKQLRTQPGDTGQASKPLISVSGYADTRSTHGPLDGLGLNDDRPEDRRIDIRFTLMSSEKKNLSDLESNLIQMREKTKKLIQALELANHAP